MRLGDSLIESIPKKVCRLQSLQHRKYGGEGDSWGQILYKGSYEDIISIENLLFARTFIPDSYSCRTGKGTHKAIDCFRYFACQVSKNNTRTCWVLKCNIRKFFASIDHAVMKDILASYIPNPHIRTLFDRIIDSFPSASSSSLYGTAPCGLPLGNLTSQLLVNIYMNEFDQFVKHNLKVKYYIRYADDFVILSHDRNQLVEIYRCIGIFLRERLKLELHLKKCSITSLASGVDFLGWVHFPDHRVLRTTSKRRMLRRLREVERKKESLQSYLGLLKHGNAYKLRRYISYPLKST